MPLEMNEKQKVKRVHVNAWENLSCGETVAFLL